MITRRTLVKAGAAASLFAPSALRAQAQTTLKFVPQTDVAGYDPVWSSAQVTRNYAYTVFDTLYGVNSAFEAKPQMAEGARPDNDFKDWTVSLRPGLKFHDGEPVLARDCVASLMRWARRDSFGQPLLNAIDELSAVDDRTMRFRMKRSFPMLPDALAKSTANVPAMMPERLAKTDPFQQIPEIVGSGPLRMLPSETVPGIKIVFARNEAYRPRDDGAPEWTSGRKEVHFDRVEWLIIPDAATAAAALQRGEIDWLEQPSSDYLPLLKSRRNIEVAIKDPSGSMGALRMNWLHPPFDNPAIRRLVLAAVHQEEYMMAVAGTDASLYRTGVGVFPPETRFASDAGMSKHAGPPDYDRIKRDLIAAGYKGEKVVVLGAADRAAVKAFGDVAAEMLTRMGMNVDYQIADWGTVNARINRKDPPEKGGWNMFFAVWGGISLINPIVHQYLRGDGPTNIAGWPSSPRLEELRAAWLGTTTASEQVRLAHEIQAQAMSDVPYVPLGQYFQPVAYLKTLTGMVTGFPVFWNIRRV
ncbi:MAG: ABC transporter substrate-binding protein [Rhizobiales bacterium]|nr:ABC transporter substrate-binding protein [Hyphomicrobiales bacterium]